MVSYIIVAIREHYSHITYSNNDFYVSKIFLIIIYIHSLGEEVVARDKEPFMLIRTMIVLKNKCPLIHNKKFSIDLTQILM